VSTRDTGPRNEWPNRVRSLNTPRSLKLLALTRQLCDNELMATTISFQSAGAGDYTVVSSGKALGFVCKRDEGWQAWIHCPAPRPNRKLGAFPTRREAADEIMIETAGEMF